MKTAVHVQSSTEVDTKALNSWTGIAQIAT